MQKFLNVLGVLVFATALLIPTSSARAEDGLVVGSVAPAWELPRVDDGDVTVKLADLKGKYVLIDFWATWCGPCVNAMANTLSPLHKGYKGVKITEGDKRFEWVLVSIGTDWNGETAAKQRKFAEEKEYGWTFVFDGDGSITEKYEVTGIPTMVVIDPEGKVQAYGHGEAAAAFAKKVVPQIDRKETATTIDAGEHTGSSPLFQEAPYVFTAGAAGTYEFKTTGDADSVLQVFSDDAETVLGENDDYEDGNYSSRVTLELKKGQKVYVSVSGFGGAAIDFGLVITAPERESGDSDGSGDAGDAGDGTDGTDDPDRQR